MKPVHAYARQVDSGSARYWSINERCTASPPRESTFSALQEGDQVFVVTDASGTFNKSVRDVALMRMAQAGAVTADWFAVACELQRDWRNDAEGLAKLLASHLPAYKNVITRYQAHSKK